MIRELAPKCLRVSKLRYFRLDVELDRHLNTTQTGRLETRHNDRCYGVVQGKHLPVSASSCKSSGVVG